MDNLMHTGALPLDRQEPVPEVRSNTLTNQAAHIPNIAAILPAYNESGRIGSLLGVLREVGQIDEIIVVDDGSQDGTAAEAIEAAALDKRIRVLRHDRNQGKGAAMFRGSSQTEAWIVLFLDSDLIGLTPSQVGDLIQPVASGQADMSIGIFKDGSFVTDLSQKVTPWLSGQRCLRRQLLSQVSPKAAAGYGVETAITIAARQRKWQVTTVPLCGVSHPTGELHRGLLTGAANRLRMYANILQAAWLAGLPGIQLARLTPRVRLLSIVMTILFAITLAFTQAQALALFRLEDLASINLEGIFRILVVDQDTSAIPDLLTAETNKQKLLDLPELDLSRLKPPALDLPILDEFPNLVEKPELIQGVALSLDEIERDAYPKTLKIRLAGDPDPDAAYTLLLVTSSGQDQVYPLNFKGVRRGQRSVLATIDLTQFDDPFLIAISLEAELGEETQRSGWTLILFPELIP